MREASIVYDAEYTEFTQQTYKWFSVSGQQQGGACYAISMHWIMSRALGLDWREPLTAPQNDKPQLKSSLPKVEGAKRLSICRCGVGWPVLPRS